MLRAAAVVLALVGSVAVLSAQGSDATARFEVTSVKPANPATLYGSSGPEPPSGWRATNFTLFMLVQWAYPDYSDPGRIIGGPSWIRDTKFDVRGKAADVLAPTAVPPMLRQLLAERFRLRVRIEPRELEVYVARLAQQDGRPGPWLCWREDGAA